jgi:superfamily I DNA/RNA helicase
VWLLNLLGILRGKGSRITLIGDPDQCIYEFSMANATSLSDLRYEWGIPEKPLSQSFRCNDAIALAVREIGGNRSFSGCGPVINDHCRPYIVKEPSEQFVNSVAEFEHSLQRAGIVQTPAAIICRARRQLETILGETNFVKLEGVTKELAQAAFLRDHQKNYKAAVKIVEAAVRDIAGDSEIWERIDEYPDSAEAAHSKLAIWRFVKNTSGLPSISLSASAWIEQIRENLDQLIGNLGVKTAQNLNQKIKKSGLLDNQMQLPLFGAKALFPSIRQETIHQVKGESIDGVLVLGSTKFWNSVVHSVANSQTSEDRRLAYVAMTRARHLLAIGLPTAHFDKHADKWVSWGFKVL